MVLGYLRAILQVSRGTDQKRIPGKEACCDAVFEIRNAAFSGEIQSSGQRRSRRLSQPGSPFLPQFKGEFILPDGFGRMEESTWRSSCATALDIQFRK